MRTSKGPVHKDLKSSSLPMEDFNRHQVPINNAGFDNVDHGLPDTAEYEEVHGSQSEGVYETIKCGNSNEQKNQTLAKRDITATY